MLMQQELLPLNRPLSPWLLSFLNVLMLRSEMHSLGGSVGLDQCVES